VSTVLLIHHDVQKALLHTQGRGSSSGAGSGQGSGHGSGHGSVASTSSSSSSTTTTTTTRQNQQQSTQILDQLCVRAPIRLALPRLSTRDEASLACVDDGHVDG
jgi:hypothetical protein